MHVEPHIHPCAKTLEGVPLSQPGFKLQRLQMHVVFAEIPCPRSEVMLWCRTKTMDDDDVDDGDGDDGDDDDGGGGGDNDAVLLLKLLQVEPRSFSC